LAALSSFLLLAISFRIETSLSQRELHPMISETFFLFQFDRVLAGIVDLKSIVRALK
jgi:hypothetical protein